MNSASQLHHGHNPAEVAATTKSVERIVITIGTLGAGGAERVLSILSGVWARRGVLVTLVTLNCGNESFYPLDPRIRRVALSEPRARPGPFRKLRLLVAIIHHVLELRREIRSADPDIVLSFIDSCNVLTLLALLGTNYPRIVSERVDPSMARISTIWRRVRPLIYPTADCVVVQTRSSAKFFEGKTIRRVEIIPNPVLVPEKIVVNERIVHGPFIAAVGRLNEQKGFDDLINAFALIAPFYPGWRLVIVGEGPQRNELTNQILRLDLKDRVVLTGLVPEPAKIVWQADLFVLSSLYEGFPNALCEAMALGKAVIATDCQSGPSDIVRAGIDGLLVPILSPKELAEAMHRLIRSPEERERLGCEAKTITSRFSLNSIMRLWDELFLRCIAERQGKWMNRE